MAGYLLPLVAFLVGLFGVFYSDKDGRKKLNAVSLCIAAGLILTCIAALYKAYSDNLSSALNNSQNERYQSELKDSIKGVSSELSVSQARNAELSSKLSLMSDAFVREKRNSDALRSIVLARSFAENNMPTKGILVIDLPQFNEEDSEKAAARNADFGKKENIESPNHEESLYPLIGIGVKETRLSIYAEDVVAAYYKIVSDHEIIAYNAPFDTNDVQQCALIKGMHVSETSEKPDSFTPLKGVRCYKDEQNPLEIFHEFARPVKALIIDLPKKTLFYESFSRIDQAQRSGTLGSISITFTSKKYRDYYIENAHKPVISVKFFRPYVDKGRRSKCTTAFQIWFETGLEKSGDDAVEMSIKGVSDQSLNICEIVPF